MTRMQLRKLLRCRLAHVIGEIRRIWLILMLCARAVERRIAPEQVKQAAKQRKQQDNDDPCNLISRIVVLTDEPDHDDKAENGERRRDRRPSLAHPAHAPHHGDQLQNQKQSASNAPVTKYPAEKSAHNDSFPYGHFSLYIMIPQQRKKVNRTQPDVQKSCATLSTFAVQLWYDEEAMKL